MTGLLSKTGVTLSAGNVWEGGTWASVDKYDHLPNQSVFWEKWRNVHFMSPEGFEL